MTTSLVSIDPLTLSAQREFNELLRGMPTPDVSTPEGLEALRELTSAASHAAPTVLQPRDVAIGDGDRSIRMRMWSPDGPSAAVMLRIHGGGWAAGLPEDDDVVNDQLARAAGITIASPEYRLQPEARLEEQIADCVAAARWLATELTDSRQPTPIIVAGISAGAHLAAAMVLKLRSEEPQVFARIAGLWLDSGVYDLSGTPSVLAASDETLVLPKAFLHGLLAHVLPGASADEQRAPQVSPLFADLTGLPPTLATVGALDPLVDDSMFLIARLRLAGAQAEVQVWPECGHAFTNMGTPLSKNVLETVTAWIADHASLAPESSDPVTGGLN
jgi:acetyl esterase